MPRRLTTTRAGLRAAVLLSAAAAFASESPDPIRTGWEQVAALQFADALRTFAAVQPATRESLLGEAVALLNRQPRTEATTQRARDLLEAVVAGGPDDDLGRTAAWLLAREAQIHRRVPDVAGARARLEALAAAPGRGTWGEWAAVKAAVLALQAEADPARRDTAFAQLEATATGLRSDAARRDLHLVLADAALRLLDQPAAAYRHLLAAEATGRLDRAVVRADVLVQIGRLAEELGDTAAAIDHYDRFLAEFPRDQRAAFLRAARDRLGGTP